MRQHLLAIDDVPLLISLFCDATPATAAEMIAILQENGGVVCVVGSPLSSRHAAVFGQADVACSLEPLAAAECCIRAVRQACAAPMPTLVPSAAAPSLPVGAGAGAAASGAQLPMAASSSSGGSGTAGSLGALQFPGVLVPPRGVPTSTTSSDPSVPGYLASFEFALASALGSLSAALPLPAETNLHHVSALVAHARQLVLVSENASMWAGAAALTVALALSLTALADTPALLTGYQLLWLVLVIIPTCSLPVLACPTGGNIMRTLPDKNEDHLTEWRRVVAYATARLVPTSLAYPGWFVWVLHTLYTQAAPAGSATIGLHYYWRPVTDAGSVGAALVDGALHLRKDPAFAAALLAAQNYALLSLVWAWVFLAAGCAHRTRGLRQYNPWRNGLWLAACLAAWTAQWIFCIVSVAPTASDRTVALLLPSSAQVLVALLWPLVTMLVDEVCKSHATDRFKYYQRGLRLAFETKLGMYSPK